MELHINQLISRWTCSKLLEQLILCKLANEKIKNDSNNNNDDNNNNNNNNDNNNIDNNNNNSDQKEKVC